jgi:hypothetical protein
MVEEPVDELMVTYLRTGDRTRLEAVADAGPAAVLLLREQLGGKVPPGVGRDAIDFMMTLSCTLAARYPSEFVAAFSAERWRNNGFVIAGYGYAAVPEVEPLLIETLSDGEKWLRSHAARALRSFPTQDARTALTAALDDPEFLVRFHVIESLGTIGDEAVLRRLAQLVEDPPDRAVEGAARRASKAISGRLGIELALPEPHWPPMEITWADD